MLGAFFFSLRHFGLFLLIHFGHSNISVICLTVVLKPAATVLYSLYLYLQTFLPNDLIFFGHFKIISVCDRKMTEKNNLGVLLKNLLKFLIATLHYFKVATTSTVLDVTTQACSRGKAFWGSFPKFCCAQKILFNRSFSLKMYFAPKTLKPGLGSTIGLPYLKGLGSTIGLPYLKRQNSWQTQWLLFATTNKRYVAFFSTFLQLTIHRKTMSLSQKEIPHKCYTTGYKR